MAKATLKKVNDYLQSQTPELELVKGEGYFYFVDTLTDDEIKNWFDGYYETPDSIYVCHMCQVTLEKWKEFIDYAVMQYHQDHPRRIGNATSTSTSMQNAISAAQNRTAE